MILCSSVLAFAQTMKVQGTVIDKVFDEPITGASVLEVGTQNGTITDLDGHFELNVQKGAQLQISYIGYETQVLPAQANMEVYLSESSKTLEEMVVTGYTAQKKADLTGSVSIVEVGDMKTAAVSDPMHALQGKVAGMTITNSGNPSENATIRIRGIGTMNDNDPLYVIDGVPTKTSLHSLNANDIESIQVLKDAASASIYGSRAGNGVIIITTKSGKQGKIKVDVDASLTASYYTHVLDVCNTEQYGQALFRAYTASGKDPNSNSISYGFNWNGDYNNPVLTSMTFGKYDGYIDAEKTMKASDTDWYDAISQTGFLQNYSVSVSNGTERGNYLLSVGYKSNEGIIKYTDYDAISARMNSSYKLFKDVVTVGENFTTTYATNVDQNQQNLALQALSIIPLHTEDGEGWGGPANGMNDRHNPLRLLNDGKDNRKKTWRMFGNAYVSIKPVKGLEFRSNFGIDYEQYFLRALTHSYKNGFLSNAETNSQLTQSHDMKWNWSNTVNYAFDWKGNNFNVLLGMEAYRKTLTYMSTYKKGYAIESLEFMWPDAGTGDAYSGGYESGYTLASYFGKIDWNYYGRYLASFTIRRDGSSRFGANNRYGTFPAATMGWRISDENFIKDNASWLDDLKIRASWGVTGNQEGIDNYAHLAKWAFGAGADDPTWHSPDYTGYDINGNGSGSIPTGYYQTQRANEDLKWETTTQWNLGFDYSLLNRAIYGNLDLYDKKTEDILLMPSYIAVVGEGGGQYVNGASIRNKGIEFSIGYRKDFACGLGLDVNANIDKYMNEVLSVPASVINNYGGNGADDNIIGHAYGSKYGYVADGLFRSQAEVDEYNKKYTYASGFVDPGLGRIRYADVNGDNKIDENDQTWIYDPTPAFSYGLNINLTYKGFDLNMFWQGVAGKDFYNYEEKKMTDFFSVSETHSNKGTRMLDAWSPTNTGSDIPALTFNNTNNEGRLSTYYIEPGDYLKLRTLQLGYTLPEKLTEKCRMQNFRCYVSGQNLLTIKSSKFTGTDPESENWGYPIPTSFSAGIQVTF